MTPIMTPRSSSDRFEEIKKRAKERRCSFHLIAGRSGEMACRDFEIALRTHPDAWNILLRDSEGSADATLSASVCRKYGWDESHAGSIFWMVQMTEAWFHADKKALQKFYGNGFKESALRKTRMARKSLRKIWKRASG